jgi:hypothetical protein
VFATRTIIRIVDINISRDVVPVNRCPGWSRSGNLDPCRASRYRLSSPATSSTPGARTASGGWRVVAWGFVQAVLSEVWTAQTTAPVGSRPLDVALALLPRLDD